MFMGPSCWPASDPKNIPRRLYYEFYSKSENNSNHFYYMNSWRRYRQIQTCADKEILDLGWYPEFRQNGKYLLVLIQENDNVDDQTNSWDNPIIKYETRSISDVINKIEEQLIQVSEGTI